MSLSDKILTNCEITEQSETWKDVKKFIKDCQKELKDDCKSNLKKCPQCARIDKIFIKHFGEKLIHSPSELLKAKVVKGKEPEAAVLNDSSSGSDICKNCGQLEENHYYKEKYCNNIKDYKLDSDKFEPENKGCECKIFITTISKPNICAKCNKPKNKGCGEKAMGYECGVTKFVKKKGIWFCKKCSGKGK